MPDLEAPHIAVAFDLSMELAINRYYRGFFSHNLKTETEVNRV